MQVYFGDREIKDSKPGELVLLSDVQVKPMVIYDADEKDLYSLLMYDPDVPEQFAPEWLHWLVVNIPGNKISEGLEVKGFQASDPPAGKIHRYIFVIYKQKGEIEPVDILRADRKGFNHSKFEKKYDLVEQATLTYRTQKLEKSLEGGSIKRYKIHY